jgi:hypothetical protein
LEDSLRDRARRGSVVLLASALAVAPAFAGVKHTEPKPAPAESSRSAASPTASSDEAEVLEALFRPRPIAESVGPAVDVYIRERMKPCRTPGKDGVPCFPVTVERKWQYSVADSLAHLEFDQRTSPSRPPTVDEMKGARPGPLSAYGNIVTFDPVCKTRQLFKMVAGTSRTYYLYRTWDASGEHVTLRDRPFEAEKFDATPRFRYLPLGSFTDECEALAAWRQALRETAARREAAADLGSGPGGSADAPGSSSSEPPP